MHAGKKPWVDVLIPTFSEPERVLVKTIAGLKQQTYDRVRVWVLDDGARQEIRTLARDSGRRVPVSNYARGREGPAISTTRFAT